MPDIADERSAVREATRRAEEAAGIFRDAEGNEVYADETTPAAPTELQGAEPVSASDQPLAPEPAAADTSEQQEPATELTLEQAQAEIARLQEQLATKDSFIGRQSTEVGEVRAEIEALRAQVVAQQAAPVVVPQVPMTVITQDMIDTDPAQATQLAFQQAKRAAEANGGQSDPAAEHILKVAFDSWKEEDPFTSGQWLTDRRLEQERERARAEIESVRNEIKEVTAPIARTTAENAERTAWGEAFQQVHAKYPDFLTIDDTTGKTNAQRLLEEVAPQFPTIAALIANGGVKEKVEGLTLLLNSAKLGNPEQVAAELQGVADEAAAEAARARSAAGVVAGQATAGQGSEAEQTYEQREVEAYKSRMTGKASLARGWTGRA